ncbi:MAG: aminotransferase [Methyloligellaceae bacterium]
MNNPDSALKPNSLEGRDIASLVHPLTNLKTHAEKGPLVLKEGRGVWIKDVHGKDYIEGMSGLWCLSLGYGQERLVAAAAEQMRELPYYHLTNHMSHPRAIELAENLLELAPVPMSKIWFANSGSEGNDCAARMVWYYWSAVGQPEKRKFISHRQAYHGNTIVSASLSGMYYNHESFGLPLDGFFHVTPPHHYRFAEAGESQDAFADRLVNELEELILREGPETIAAFFTEPIMGSGGVIVPPDSYFDKVQAVLAKYDILLVVDEVITGFARTGNMFGTTTMKLNPDLIVCAKGLSSAYLPISAVFVNEKVYEAMREESDRVGVFGLSFTYSGHPVSAAVALEALKIYEENNIVAHAGKVGRLLRDGLARLADHALVGEVRGKGLLAGVELVADKESHQPFPADKKVGAICNQYAQERGLIVRAIGDTISFCPPLIIEADEVEELISRFAGALDDTWKALNQSA